MRHGLHNERCNTEQDYPCHVATKNTTRHGVSYHITHVRNIMRRYNMSPKVSQPLHVNHATVSQVRNWQYRLNESISCLKSDDFTVCIMDEAIFIHDSMRGRKYWSPIVTRIVTPYIGNHKRIIVYDAIIGDGRQMFRTHEKFNGNAFYDYAIQLHRKWGKIAVLCDRAHRTRHKRSKDCCAPIRVLESSICHVVLHILMP